MYISFITGITGQDGSLLADHLLSLGHNVIGLVRRCSHNNTERIKSILNNKNLILVDGDLADFSSLYRVINEYRPHYIYNLASQSFVKSSFNQPIYTFDITGKGVLNILEVIRLLHTNYYNPKFYQASSSEIFGDQYDLDNNDKPIQSENTAMNPQSVYGISKLAGYHLTKLYRKSYGIFASNGILFNHECERRGEEFVTKKISKYVGRMYAECGHRIKNFILTNNPYPKLNLGNLSAKRDWGHAKDYIKGMELILNHSEPDDFVLATGETHSVEEFVEEAFKYIGLNWKDYINIDPGLYRPSEVPYLRGCAGKAERELGWKPQVKFKELVHEMVQYEINNC